MANPRCDQCAIPIKKADACLVVHHPGGVSGTFCGDKCYQDKIRSVGEPASVITTIRELHADAEVVIGSG